MSYYRAFLVKKLLIFFKTSELTGNSWIGPGGLGAAGGIRVSGGM
jgi:hypothetical protein